jgi:DNA-directed RNA polymerase subunit K
MEKLARFERARVIGARALQLSMGAPPLVDVKGAIDPVAVAYKEFDKSVVPIAIVRE